MLTVSTIEKFAQLQLVLMQYFHGTTLVLYDSHCALDFDQLVLPFQVVIVVNTTAALNPSISVPTNGTLILPCGMSRVILKSLKKLPSRNRRSPIMLLIFENDRNIIKKWLTWLWEKIRASEVVVMTPNNEFYTWIPYQPKTCSRVEQIDKIININKLFPRRQKTWQNLNGCDVSVITDSFPPYVGLNKDFRHDNGIETKMFQVMSEKLNFSQQYIKLPNGSYVWSFITQDGEPLNGMIEIRENRADLMFSGLQMTYYTYKLCDILFPHTEDSYVFFLPAAKPLPPAMAFILAFTVEMWISVGITFLCVFVFCSFLSYPKLYSITDSIALTLNFPMQFPTSLVYRVFVTITYSAALHIATAYQSSIWWFLMTPPKEVQISTLNEVADSNYQIIYHDSTTNFFNASNHQMWAKLLDPNRASIVQYFETDRIHIDHVLLTYKFAFILYFLQRGYRGKITYLPQRFVSIQVAMFMSPGHPLFNTFNKLTRCLIEGGFTSYWRRNFFGPEDDLNIVHYSSEPISLNIKHLFGAFALLGISWAICCSVFLVELFARRYSNLLGVVSQKIKSKIMSIF